MIHDELIRQARELARHYRVDDRSGFSLATFEPGDTAGFDSDMQARWLLERGIELIAELQEQLYARDHWALLMVFRAMDAAGKDSTIKHVISGITPQDCQVFSFKAPSAKELDHDYVWRTTCCLLERGRIGIFDRSYYEEVLVVRVHPTILAGQKLAYDRVTERIWEQRCEDIAAFERFLARNGTAVRKFFQHLSKDEQKKRLVKRLDRADTSWKFSAADVEERRH